jgi:5'-AMP-activated protein kinase catalytic alpha subunit
MGTIPSLLLGHYKLNRLLRNGTFTNVYNMCTVGTRDEVAIKIMDRDHLSKLSTV